VTRADAEKRWRCVQLAHVSFGAGGATAWVRRVLRGARSSVSPHPPTDQHRFAPTPSTTPRLPRSDVSAKDMVDIATGQIHVARMLSLEFITSKWCSLFYSAPGRSSP
jgi:hypothetical protein